jgi:hypothetical protein
MGGVAVRPGREGARVRIAIAVVGALCAAFCFALGSLVQQDAARQTRARALRIGLLAALIRDRRWLGGITVTVLSFGVQGVALAFGPLALVQPLVATEVLFALLMVARRNRRPLTRRGIGGGLGVASGMGIFVAVSPPAGGVSVPDLAAWAPTLAAMTGVTVLSALAALRTRGTARVIWLAAATAVIYALIDAVTKTLRAVSICSRSGAQACSPRGSRTRWWRRASWALCLARAPSTPDRCRSACRSSTPSNQSPRSSSLWRYSASI